MCGIEERICYNSILSSYFMEYPSPQSYYFVQHNFTKLYYVLNYNYNYYYYYYYYYYLLQFGFPSVVVGLTLVINKS